VIVDADFSVQRPFFRVVLIAFIIFNNCCLIVIDNHSVVLFQGIHHNNFSFTCWRLRRPSIGWIAPRKYPVNVSSVSLDRLNKTNTSVVWPFTDPVTLWIISYSSRFWLLSGLNLHVFNFDEHRQLWISIFIVKGHWIQSIVGSSVKVY